MLQYVLMTNCIAVRVRFPPRQISVFLLGRDIGYIIVHIGHASPVFQQEVLYSCHVFHGNRDFFDLRLVGGLLEHAVRCVITVLHFTVVDFHWHPFVELISSTFNPSDQAPTRQHFQGQRGDHTMHRDSRSSIPVVIPVILTIHLGCLLEK